jgi:hypothetical protein
LPEPYDLLAEAPTHVAVAIVVFALFHFTPLDSHATQYFGFFVEFFCGLHVFRRKNHPSHKRMGFDIEFLTSPAVPLPIIIGPETLRPTLSEGLPFSQLFYLEFLIGMCGTDL